MSSSCGTLSIICSQDFSQTEVSRAAWNVDYEGISTISAECSLMRVLHTNRHHPPLHFPASYWLVSRVKREDGLLRDERWSRWIFQIWFSRSSEKPAVVDSHAEQSVMYTVYVRLVKKCMPWFWCVFLIDTCTRVISIGSFPSSRGLN